MRLDRRRFLGMLAASGGAVALAGCSSGGSEATTSSPADAKDPSTTTTLPEVPAGAGIDSDPFLLGVASGDPLPSSVILWTKLLADLETGLGATDHQVRWEVATDESFDHIVAGGLAPAASAVGHAVHVEVTGLDPATSYWYRFQIGDHTSPVGKTRTTPDDDAEVDQLRFAFASCQLRTKGYWTAYDHLVADEPDLVFFLGDYIYEYPGGEGDTAIPLDAEPQTLDDYRVLYAAYKRDPKIQAAHAIAPWVVTWDDHEVVNNYVGDPTDERQVAAYQAFWEHHPMRIDPPAEDGSLEVYRSLRYGTLAEFFVLDGRQYRTPQPCGGGVAVDRTQCDDLDDPDATMLGTEQETWLTKGLGASDATWKVLAQQTVMKALVLGDIVLNVDQWDGYPVERTRLLQSIADQEVENVVVLTGDIHAAGAADLRLPDATTDGPIVAHELVAPGISSPGLGALGQAIDLSTIGLAYANFEDNGYVRATVTPDRWETEFVAVDTITTPTSEARVDGKVAIEAGTPGVTRL